MDLDVLHRPDGVVLVDGGDLGCARLLLRLRGVVADLAPGTVVHLDTTDPVAPIDLPAWCRMTGHDYLGRVDPAPRPERPEAVRYGVRVAADARATSDASPWRLA
ncbi:sulfurtransferase TusA family protein [Nocardioides zeae]|uniref:Sulfurtransferase TusA family protein n=1 Tax=Nocardioides imazamoxiresistens TaxID=3231893 RepID=A0ABU3Q2I2_9ACTN|nr:sulfurtransferase TusA family protein [Nocardioides zeae]MDT9595257.1 sulfurtransferase TusA family protein [Nocardioides zeae]